MRNKISVLLDIVPKYGEILLGVGCVALESQEQLLDDIEAKEQLKGYLLNNAAKKKNLVNFVKDSEFQLFMYKHIGKFAFINAINRENEKDKTVDILILKFFSEVIWPILVEQFIDKISSQKEHVKIRINIKKNVYLTIYGEDNPDLFFDEFKAFLIYNCIVISDASIQENGDILTELMLPIPPYITNENN